MSNDSYAEILRQERLRKVEEAVLTMNVRLGALEKDRDAAAQHRFSLPARILAAVAAGCAVVGVSLQIYLAAG